MMMHGGGGIFKLLLSLALGYGVCILARRESGVLKTLGYVIGTAILVFSIIYALVISGWLTYLMAKGMCPTVPLEKICPMMKR